MKPRRQASRAALELIERFEGFRASAAQLPDGRWTIGYGHTKTARPGAQVSVGDAEALLIYDLLEVNAALAEVVLTPLSQNQHDALSAFVFNIGVDNFRSSAVLRRINAGELLQGAYAMELWRKAEFDGEAIVVDALVRRRAAEKILFLTPVEGFVAVPTPLLKPRFDSDSPDYTPTQAPVEVAPSLQDDRINVRRVEPPLIPAPIEDKEQSDSQDHAAPPADSPDEVVYDGTPIVEDAPSAPLPSAQAFPEAHVEPIAESVPPDASLTLGAAAAPAPPVKAVRSLLRWSAGLGVIGAVLFGVGFATVYRGSYYHSGSVGAGLALGIIGLLCLAAAAYLVLDRLGGRDNPV